MNKILYKLYIKDPKAIEDLTNVPSFFNKVKNGVSVLAESPESAREIANIQHPIKISYEINPGHYSAIDAETEKVLEKYKGLWINPSLTCIE